MPRTNDDLVKGVLLGDYDAINSPSLTPFISIANKFISNYATYVSSTGGSIADDVLTDMETWVAAHAYVSVDQTYSSKSTGGSSGSFQGQTGMFLKGSKYGQMACLLDDYGYLSDFENMGAPPTFDWAGTKSRNRRSFARRNR
jgi:hypothetical protein